MLNEKNPLKAKRAFVENGTTPIALIKVMILFFGIAIINIWPIENSIAARNIVLAFGAAFSLILLLLSYKTLTAACLTPLYFLLGLVGWVLLLYFVKPTAPTVQWQEITSTWLRVVLALLLGTGLGLTISASSTLRKFVLFGFLPFLIIQSLVYIHQCYELGGLAAPFTPGIFITKAGGTYFLMWPFLLLCAYMDYLFSSTISNIQQVNIKLKLGFCLLIFAMCFLAFYSLNSLNGILIAIICSFLLLGKITVKVLFHKKHRIFGAIIFIIFTIVGAFTIHVYSKYDGNKLKHLFQDIKISVQIDRYTNWRGNTHVQAPEISDGHPVNQSTYFRVASFINGTRLILEHPFGTGFTYLPYKYYMARAYPGSKVTHTHSGWIDFTLGVGIPGLLLCWLAMASTIRSAIKKHWLERENSTPLNLWSYIVIWGLGGISMLWVLAEVSEKEYIEHLMFMIAFFAAGNTPLPSKKEDLPPYNP
jgi:hypothetical protein